MLPRAEFVNNMNMFAFCPFLIMQLGYFSFPPPSESLLHDSAAVSLWDTLSSSLENKYPFQQNRLHWMAFFIFSAKLRS